MKVVVLARRTQDNYQRTFPVLLHQLWKSPELAAPPTIVERVFPDRTWREIADTWYEEVELRRPDAVVLQARQADPARLRLRPWRKTPTDFAALEEILDRARRCAVPSVFLFPLDTESLAWLKPRRAHLGRGPTRFFLCARPTLARPNLSAEQHRFLRDFIADRLHPTQKLPPRNDAERLFQTVHS